MSGSGDGYRYIWGRSMAGFVSPTGRFYTLMKGTTPFTATPHQYTVCSSTMGLLLLRHRQGSDLLYSVCNPFLTDQPLREIPKPPRDHPDNIPRVLVVNWDPYLLCLVFRIVCALPVEELPLDSHTYSLDIFSSHNDQWETRILPQNKSTEFWQIRENTGFSLGECVYWLLDNEHRLMIYNSRSHFVRFLWLPHLVQTPGDYGLFRTQLGRWKTNLCLVVVYFDKKWIVELYWLESDDKWIHGTMFNIKLDHVLSRFESAKLQVPFWNDRALILVEDCWTQNDNKDLIRFIKCSKKLPVAHGDPEDQMPYITSRWHPKDHFLVTTSPDESSPDESSPDE